MPAVNIDKTNADNYRMVRLQLIDEITGEPLDYVNVLTNAKSVTLTGGGILQEVIDQMAYNLQSTIVQSASNSSEIRQHVTDGSIHVIPDKIQNAFIGYDYNPKTGVITWKKYDGTTEDWDTALEKVPIKVGFNEDTNCLEFTQENGDPFEVNIGKLVDVYKGSTGAEIAVSVLKNTISASIIAESIKLAHLSPEVKEYLNASKKFIETYEEKIKGIEEGANKYALPIAGPVTTTSIHGGVIVGHNMNVDEDGVISAANILLGETADKAVPTNLFMKVINTVGPSTDPMPVLEVGESYVTAEGNFIYYVSTDKYYYVNNTMDASVIVDLTTEEVNKKLFRGLELINVDDLTWREDATAYYATVASGEGFIYEKESPVFISYISPTELINLINKDSISRVYDAIRVTDEGLWERTPYSPVTPPTTES